MALHLRSLWKVVKPNFFSLCTAVFSESVLQTRGKVPKNVSFLKYGMTSFRRPSVDLRKCWRGSSRQSKGRNEKYPYIGLMLIPALFEGRANDSTADDSTPEQKLVNHIKRSILLIQNGESDKAERLLHIALKMAQDLRHEKGITYIYDTMANLAFETGQFSKAQSLFVNVLRRLIGGGLPQDDIIVVNISLKIADCYAALSDYQKAEQGFLFCIDTLKKKVSAGADDEDTNMLYSQALDRYSLFLLHVNKPKEALQFMETAIEVAESTLGDINNGIGAILLSDMGVIKTAAGDTEGGSVCFDKALTLAHQETVDASTAVIMVNRGVALNEIGLLPEAKHWCGLGLKQAVKEKNKPVIQAAEACLKENTSNISKAKNGVIYSQV